MRTLSAVWLAATLHASRPPLRRSLARRVRVYAIVLDDYHVERMGSCA